MSARDYVLTVAAGIVVGMIGAAILAFGDILCLFGRHRWAIAPINGWHRCQRKGCSARMIEVALPPPPTRGACGIMGCPNMRPHSHALDLVRRLREPRR